MKLKEFNKYIAEWEEIEEEALNEYAVGHSPSNDYNPTSQPQDRLTRVHGRKYAFSGPSVQRITRKDKMAILKEKDLAKVMPVIENALQIIVAAANGTKEQNFILSRINNFRRQIQKKVQ